MTDILAFILGVVAGLIAVACNIIIPQLTPAVDPYKRIAYGTIGLLVSTLFAIGAIGAYWYYFRATFSSFGVALCLSYGFGILVFALLKSP